MMMPDTYIAVDGTEIRYRDSGGPGVPIVLCHGIGGSLELWSRQFEALGRTHRLIAWDAPNHGLSGLTGRIEDWTSYAHWLLRFTEALRLDQLIAVGNSMGGALSLRLAGLAPARVRGVVLANAASLGPEVFIAFRLMTLPGLGGLMTRASDKNVDMAVQSIVKDRACIDDALRAALRRNQFKQGGDAAFLATLRAGTTLFGQRAAVWQESHRLLSSLDVPMLILHGREDGVLPYGHSERAAQMARHAKLVLLDDCGHTPQVEKPAAFNDALTGFVAGLG